MSFIDRYNKGETIGVYSEILSLGQQAFSEQYYMDVEAVVTEIMNRAGFNLGIIHNALRKRNYNFKKDSQNNFEKPLIEPLKNATELLCELEKVVDPFGSIPLSLKLFYQVVGSCSFEWDYKTNKDNPWEGADPIQITSLDSLVEQVTDEYWSEEIRGNKEEYGVPFLELSADYLHKDNISGGEAYSIEITPIKTVDSRFLFEENGTSFINYLRIIFENCGFGRTAHLVGRPDFDSYFKEVSPKLKRI
ncbi:hypothetical protein [Desertivirga brevis]|uniref:hypothetical protein n=1 Tax=Desertivirga brevis TaxID=2810310 RepID=UPI001A96040D|nr:hypothetical protein [Pedobacter sp. SYSU D00873]